MNALVDGINRIADAWWFWILQAGWQSACLGCVLLAAVAWGRRWTSQIRYGLLVIALLKFAVPPLWSAPTGVFSHIPVTSRHTAPASPIANATANAPADFQPRRDSSQNASHAPGFRTLSADGNEIAASDGPDKLLNTSVHQVVTPTAAHGSPWLGFGSESLTRKSLLFALHVLGTIGILAWVAIQFQSVRQITARSRHVASGPIAESLRRVSTHLALGLSARVLLSPDVAAPLATGTLRPTVILPVSSERLSARELDAVLLHELTHLRRGDAWLAWLQVFLCAVWWFHPVVWLVNRSLRRVREDCCDDAILVSGIATQGEYCDTLLRVAGGAMAHHAHLACHMAGRLHPVGDRIRRIMDTRVRRSQRMPRAATAALVILACIALPGLGRSADKNDAAARSDFQADQGKTTARPDKRPSRTGYASVDLKKDGKSAKSERVGVLPESDPLGHQVYEAVFSARNFLAGTQNLDGSFMDFAAKNDEAPEFLGPSSRPAMRAHPPGYPIGTTSLVVLTLLSAGMRPDDPVIVNGVDFLRKSPEPSTYFATYETALEIAALVAAKQWDRDRARIRTLVRSLEDNQIKRSSQAGMWNYGPSLIAVDGDNSNTEFALFGLHATAAMGALVKRETWERSCDHFVNSQNRDGGWGYRNGNSSTGSMTCGAVASLLLCNQILPPSHAEVAKGSNHADERASDRDRAIKKGIAWISRYFGIGVNPGQGTQWALYYQMQLARAGRLAGRQRFGDHDWYRQGAAYLISGQSSRDGSWQSAQGPESDKRLATCYALLFLCEPASERRSP